MTCDDMSSAQHSLINDSRSYLPCTYSWASYTTRPVAVVHQSLKSIDRGRIGRGYNNCIRGPLLAVGFGPKLSKFM